MKMKDFEEIIDAYLRNELSNEEKVEFEKNIQHNIELQNQFNEIYEIRQGLKYSNLKSASSSLRNLEEKLSKDEVMPRAAKKIDLKWIILIAIIGLVCLAGYFFLNKITENNSQEPLHVTIFDVEEFDQYIYHDTERGTHMSKELTDAQSTAYHEYAVQDFETCIPLLEKLWVDDKDTLAYYYLGISNFAMDKHSIAESILSSSFFKEYNNPMD